LDSNALSKAVLSVFTRESIPGHVFVESPSEQKLKKALENLSCVRSQHITRVPLEECTALLDFRVQTLSVKVGDWVKPRIGLYKNDLGIVTYIDREDICVSLVPRINYDKKRTRRNRPHPSLFDKALATQIHGPDSVVTRNNVHFFRNNTYNNGFLEKTYWLPQLIQEIFYPEDHEVPQFSTFPHTRARFPPSERLRYFQPGDNVDILSGELSGFRGTISAINENDLSVSTASLETDIILSPGDVTKVFQIGDVVEVRNGPEKGRKGWVVELKGPDVIMVEEISKEQVSYAICKAPMSCLIMF
jgi:transcription elongation factor SPT5